jgi:cyclophilin family peptidyl-prolyl cis-trans isomerase
MSELIFAQQQQWSTTSADQARQMFISYAADLGLDTERFTTDLEQGVYTGIVQASYQQAVAQALSGTPTIFINGQLFQAPLSYYWLDALVRLELLAQRDYDAAPEMIIDPGKQYQAIIRTAKGDIVVELDSENAPLTVNNFVFLAQEGWYDGTSFFRVLPSFVAQGGDPTNTGLGGPGYDLPAEIKLLHEPGAIAMARQSDEVNPERRSSGSQFYIALDTLSDLDGAYTVFGYVVEGMDVALALTPRDPAQSLDLPPGDEIMTIEIRESSE